MTELERAANITAQIKKAVTLKSGKKQKLDPTPFQHLFNIALERDLDTPAAIEQVAKLADEILAVSQSGGDILESQQVLRACGHILGLRLDADRPDPGVVNGWDEHLLKFQ